MSAFLTKLYAEWLASLERFIVVILTAALCLGGLAVIFGVFDDPGTVQTVLYAVAFYLGLFGGVLATRKANHIAIDAVTHYLPARVQLRLEGLIMLGSAVVVLWIGERAYYYVYHVVTDHQELIPAMGGGVWALRPWVWPIGLCFGWMGLHFLVGGMVRLAGKRPEELGLAPSETTTESFLADDAETHDATRTDTGGDS